MLTRVLILAAALSPMVHAQSDWPGYGHDKGAQRHSPLTQINTANVSTLAPAWTFSMKNEGKPFRPSQSIPLVVDGIMYLSWPFNRVAALEPETGKVIWEFAAKSDNLGKLVRCGASNIGLETGSSRRKLCSAPKRANFMP